MSDPASKEYNIDSTGLMQIMMMVAAKNSNLTGDEKYLNETLTDSEIYHIYKNSRLIQKIVNKYPEEFKTLGYEIKNKDGQIVEKNNDVLLEAIKDGLIAARLYGKCFLKLEFDDFDEGRPIKQKLNLIDHSIYYDLFRSGDFYNVNSKPVHYTRVIEIIGQKTYRKYSNKNDIDYYQSIIQPIYSSFKNLIDNHNSAKYLLNNLAYLSIGIENLGNMQMSDEGRKNVFDRLTALNLNRNISRIIAYDKSKESIGFINQSISGIKDLIEESKAMLASETDYPVSEIFEIGQNQSLGSGIQNQLVARYLWARRVRNWCLNNALPYLKIYFNRIRDMSNLIIDIPFIVELTDEEKAEIEQKAANRSKILIEAGVVSPKEIREGYRNEKFDLNIVLDDKLFKSNKDSTPASTDSIPEDDFWDELSKITAADLDILARNTLSGNFFLIDDFDSNNFDVSKPVFEIETKSGSIFAVNFDDIESAEKAFIDIYDPSVASYIGISEVIKISENNDINNDRGCPADKIIRSANGRFAGCRGGAGRGGGGGQSVSAPKSINSKTNIAQLKAILEKENIDMPKSRTGLRQTYIDLIKEKTGDKYISVKKSKTKVEDIKEFIENQKTQIREKYKKEYEKADDELRKMNEKVMKQIESGDVSKKDLEKREQLENKFFDLRDKLRKEIESLETEKFTALINQNKVIEKNIKTHGMSDAEDMYRVRYSGVDVYFGNTTQKAFTDSVDAGALRIDKMPAHFTKPTEKIYFTSQGNEKDGYWAKKYNIPNFKSSATGGNGSIVVYHGNPASKGTIIHEMGHNFAKYKYGKTTPLENSDYAIAAKKDGKHISKYGNVSLAEDFAETARLYFDNRNLLKSKSPERFKVFDKLMNDEKYRG